MRKLILFALLLVPVLLVPSPAAAAGPSAKQFAALQAQVNRQAAELQRLKREYAADARLTAYCLGEATDLGSLLDYYVGPFLTGWLPLDDQRLGLYVLAVNPECVRAVADGSNSGDQRLLSAVPR